MAKVDQQSYFNTGGFQIIDKLNFMDFCQIFDCFQFKNDLVLNNNINYIDPLFRFHSKQL
jgi:hypothetical protein